MDRKEMAYAKLALMGIRDWDAFQTVMRTCSRALKGVVPTSRMLCGVKKKG